MSALRENWRIGVLVVLLLVSTVALFVPGAPPGSTDSEGAGGDQLTNLQYGIELSGGARIQAPVVGMTAEGVDVAPDEQARAQSAIANRLGVDPIDVEIRPATQQGQNGTVELFNENVTRAEFRTALEAEGYNPSTVRQGVTDATRTEMVSDIEEKITTSALSGGRVQEVNSPGGRNFISITAPGRDAEELIDILEERGVVRVYAVYQNDTTGNWTHQQVLSQEEFARIGNAQNPQNSGPVVPVTIEQSAAERFQNDMAEAGFGNGVSCGARPENHDSVESINSTCLVTTLNGQPVFIGGVRPSLGQSFADGSFATDPQFQMETTSMDEARELELSLDAGRLKSDLDFEAGNRNSLSPALADQFKTNSLITGLLAVLAVSLVVYGRYRRREVALPMIVTALSEVYILLGFVALAQYPLNLSHLAGFIAVIGTGVDDLIIIGDEILQQGKVDTGRVFQSRFRKAFWVIGAAAATTIVAMLPMVAFPLGDLSGFAIITIVGVLIGVLITRPAYGDILRNLVLDE
ncbi:preprotein translocase subunit SecD [Haloarcula sp. S1CR25-12]|uniref:Protein-export membrane protein SecD n=1 Tax=Haloarcula saliterrae TaxID=2950534 RepID=A0ABU2FC00_9EURY|nr:preprotein translocase subunit SecD [Haloarcula sp. S1CR25-12]MDS0259800.1 preprotein translocase subunit SecD [Haloarcula sp. S1CR25-12]